MNKDFSDFEAFVLTDEAKAIRDAQWDKTYSEHLALIASEEDQNEARAVAAMSASRMAAIRLYHEWINS